MHFHPPHSSTAVGRGVEEILGTAFYRLFYYFKRNISTTTHTNRNKIKTKYNPNISNFHSILNTSSLLKAVKL